MLNVSRSLFLSLFMKSTRISINNEVILLTTMMEFWAKNNGSINTLLFSYASCKQITKKTFLDLSKLGKSLNLTFRVSSTQTEHETLPVLTNMVSKILMSPWDFLERFQLKRNDNFLCFCGLNFGTNISFFLKRSPSGKIFHKYLFFSFSSAVKAPPEWSDESDAENADTDTIPSSKCFDWFKD